MIKEYQSCEIELTLKCNHCLTSSEKKNQIYITNNNNNNESNKKIKINNKNNNKNKINKSSDSPPVSSPLG